MSDRSSRSEQPVQLRIGFSPPTRPITLHLALSGLSILAEAIHGTYDEIFHYLSAAGIVATADAIRGISFPVSSLPRLADLPDQVNVAPETALRPLYLMCVHPSANNKPASLSLGFAGDLRLSWFDGQHNWDEELLPTVAVALLNSELPFVATIEAWDVLKSSCRLPVLAGRARVNLDRFIEITAPVSPQLLESAPLPGLFRIDDTHFGIALPYASAIDTNPGFVWEGHKPVLERSPARLPELPIPLSSHASSDLRNIVDQLAAYRAQAVVWESGLGRRIFALAAVEALDAWPLLIVTPPSGVWMWQRHLDLLGRTHSLTHDRSDALIVTYLDLAKRKSTPSPQAIIFDELVSSEAGSPSVRTALRRLDGLPDAYRLGCDSRWPTDLMEAVNIMSVLRPGEFRSDVPLVQRYPLHTEQRAGEHVEAYVSRRAQADPDSQSSMPFRRSSVVNLRPSEAQVSAFSDAAARSRSLNPTGVLSEVLEIVSAGPAHSISPKVAAAAGRAKEAAKAGRTVAVLTRHRRTAMLIKASLRPLPVTTFDASEGDVSTDSGVAVVLYETQIPNLRAFDEVVVVDYPWNTNTLERAIGSSADERGPSRVTCIHMIGTVDDRLAMLSTRRADVGVVGASESPPSLDEIAYLLAPR